MRQSYYWTNWERPSLLTRRWLKAWAKRALNLPAWVAYKTIILPRGESAVVGAGTGNPAEIVEQRCDELLHSPVDLGSPFSWLGNPAKLNKATPEISLTSERRKC